VTEPTSDPTPRASVLDWVSASTAENLRACRLRVAFSRDDRWSHLRRPTPATLLGQASHELTERAYHGVLSAQPDPRAVAVSQWADLISHAEQELCTAWGASVPPANRWPGYQLSRVQAIRRATEIAARKRGGGRGDGDYVNLVERTLRDEHLQLYGRPDRISRTAEGTVVHDLKTGWAQTPEVQPHQRRQLLFYAHLAAVGLDALPSRAEIETGDGSTVGFQVDAEEVDALVRDVINLRDRFNVDRATVAPAAMASPSADTCRFCDFRPVCVPYLRSVRDDWEWSATRAGWVRTTSESSQGAAVDLAVVWPEEARGVRTRVTRVPSPVAPPVGSFAAIVNAEPTPSPAQLRARWNTSVEVWSDGAAAGQGAQS
jgi:RecB family exonuclease